MDKIKILVVDDEPDLLEITVEGLEMFGFEVLSATSGMEALKVLEKSQVDLIVSDIRMRNGDGIFLLENIRKANPLLPVLVFMTGFSNVSVEECVSKGACCVIEKPFSHERLLEAVKKALPEKSI